MKFYKLSVFLVALLLVSTAFIPLVSAAATNREMATIAEKLRMTKVSDDGKVSEYTATYKVSDSVTKTYLVKKYSAAVDGRTVVKAEVYEQNAQEGLTPLAANNVFGKDSYAYYTGSGWAIHIGPVDMGYLSSAGLTGAGVFGTWLAAAIGLADLPAAALAIALAGTVFIAGYFYSNRDGSMDIFISNISLALIPIFAVLPGGQPVPITVKGMTVTLSI
jgi:hypothetical protein